MIFVTVGSVAPFDALIKKVDELTCEGLGEVVAQIGDGNYVPKSIKWFRFENALDKYYQSADLIITHNGAGTLFELLRLGKKAISVPNPNTVQLMNIDIVTKLSEDNYILTCMELEKLGETIEIAMNWVGKIYETPQCQIADKIANYLLGPAK